MQKTVLIVEDVSDIQALMMVMVTSYGYHAVTAADGQQAVQKVTDYHPDLVFMDIMMPEMDGLEATRIIRRSVGYQLPIIALTAFHEEFHHEALEAGCNGVIPKPINFDDLRAVLHQYLDQ